MAPIDSEEFRAAMATRAGAVAIATSRAGDVIHGMTVTDWAGVSVTPPLVLLCADKTSNTLGVIQQSQCFAINLLAAGQEDLSNKFASKKEEATRFDGLELSSGTTGAPLITSAITNLDCQVVAAHDVGDHWVFIGQVEEVVRRGGDPLVYFGGAYKRIADA
ncbi:MAG: flavin reductase family protein [Myxococcota bacterium]|nr:flavin reductase family protein [Myxococcota bacterium]